MSETDEVASNINYRPTSLTDAAEHVCKLMPDETTTVRDRVAWALWQNEVAKRTKEARNAEVVGKIFSGMVYVCGGNEHRGLYVIDDHPGMPPESRRSIEAAGYIRCHMVAIEVRDD